MPTISFKGRHFQHDMILQSVRWYLAYSLSYRDIEELMQERDFSVDHSTINRWVLHYSPQLEAAFRRKRKRAGNRWRMDETYIKVNGQWKYYYRAIAKQGQTIHQYFFVSVEYLRQNPIWFAWTQSANPKLN